MLNSWLPYEEQKALEQILRHHQVEDPELTKHLAEFINWVKDAEKAKSSFHRTEPPFLIGVLSSMGIYGGEVLEPKK